MESSRSGPPSRSSRRLLTQLRGSFRHDPENVIIFVVAAVVAVLGATDAVSDTKILLSVTLATLAILGFSLFKQSARREVDGGQIESLTKAMTSATEKLAKIEKTIFPAGSADELAAGEQRSQAFKEAMTTADRWQFQGGTGTFTRAWTLPTLAAKARGYAGSAWSVKLQILDPTDRKLCTQYAAYRTKLAQHRSAPSDNTWTPEQVQLECLATIFAAQWYHQHEFLHIEVGLRKDFSTLRHDISPSAVVITNEDRRYPALRIRNSGSSFALYNAFIADFEHSFRSILVLKPGSPVRIPKEIEKITSEHVLEVLLAAGLEERVLTTLPLNILPELALRRDNPYF